MPAGRELREALAHVPTSVVVVTTMDGTEPVGSTIGSLVSVSLDPPLVAYFAMKTSSTLRAVRRARAFSVNVLAGGQDELARAFARSREERFRSVAWTRGPGGMPHLDGALMALDCHLEEVLTVGDHEMVVGRVIGLTAARPSLEPLVFARGTLRGLDPEARPPGLLA